MNMVALSTGHHIPKKPYKPSYRHQLGLTLIELMISITIGMVAVAGAIKALQISQQTQKFASAIEELNEYGRFAMMHLRSDLRNAGDNGCPSWLVRSSNTQEIMGMGQAFVSTIQKGSDPAWFGEFYRGVEGFSSVPTFLSGFNVDGDSDILLVHRTDPRKQYGVSNQQGGNFTLDQNHDFDDTVIAMATTPDCIQSALFVAQVSGDNTLSLNAVPGSYSYSNCSTQLRGQSVACTGSTDSLELDQQTTISQVVTAAYYIDSQTQQLMRFTAGDDEPLALVNGVSAMTLRYGLDSDGDGVSNQFYTADAITAEQWSTVISVDVAIVLESDSSVLTASEANQILACGPEEYSATAKLRSCFTSRVNIRNRGGIQI